MNNGLVIEFGVLHGRSLRVLGNKFNDRIVYGFDSFDGLNEDWGGIAKKNSMSCKGQLPKNLPYNVKLIVGLIQDTLPIFLSVNNSNISFIHIDTDTYETAKCILNNIYDRLQIGSIILFDEYRGYVGYENHEYRAFKEFQNNHPNLYFEELNINDPNNWSIKRSFNYYDIIYSIIYRPTEIVKAIWGRLIKKKVQTQAMFKLVRFNHDNT